MCIRDRLQGVSLADISHLDDNLEISHVEEVPMSNYCLLYTSTSASQLLIVVLLIYPVDGSAFTLLLTRGKRVLRMMRAALFQTALYSM